MMRTGQRETFFMEDDHCLPGFENGPSGAHWSVVYID